MLLALLVEEGCLAQDLVEEDCGLVVGGCLAQGLVEEDCQDCGLVEERCLVEGCQLQTQTNPAGEEANPPLAP